MKRSHCYFVRVVLILNCILIFTSTVFILTLLTRNRIGSTYTYDIRMTKPAWKSDIDKSLLSADNNTNILLSILERILKEEKRVGDIYSDQIVSEFESVIVMVQKSGLRRGERTMQSLLLHPIVNNHSFSYIHNPSDICTEQQFEVIYALPSSTTNFEKRSNIRTMFYKDCENLPRNAAKMLFFLGRPAENENSTFIQDKIDAEVMAFGDIVQENFEDVYSNNRLKSVSVLRWVSTYCSKAKYLVRSDDDIGATISTLLPVLAKTSAKINSFIIGSKYVDDPPARNLGSKYYMSWDEYPLAVLPPYLRGGLLGFSVNSTGMLYEAALRIKPIWLEDVYITGICAAKAHIPILAHPAFTFKHVPTK